jgi:delta1-piperideine-2-carboxylate reductase
MLTRVPQAYRNRTDKKAEGIMGDDRVRLMLDEVRDLAVRALEANGCDAPNAAAVARTVTAAERDGAKSHGLFRIPGYVGSLRNGKVNGRADPQVRRIGPCAVIVEGDRGFAPLAIERGRPPLIEAARENGMAALAIRRTHHYAALWPETQGLAEAGLVAMAFVNSPPYMAPAGGKRAFFGTNPMSFAWPRPRGGAMVWDQASAAMARGEIMIAGRDGHALPPGVALDAEGEPTTDPAAALKGAQLPFGGYKGAAIALMVDLMAGPLIGEVSSWEAGEADNGDGGPATGGELILALDPTRFGAADAIERGERLFADLLAMEGTRLPGDRRIAARRRTPAEGTEIPARLHATILGLIG